MRISSISFVCFVKKNEKNRYQLNETFKVYFLHSMCRSIVIFFVAKIKQFLVFFHTAIFSKYYSFYQVDFHGKQQRNYNKEMTPLKKEQIPRMDSILFVCIMVASHFLLTIHTASTLATRLFFGEFSLFFFHSLPLQRKCHEIC